MQLPEETRRAVLDQQDTGVFSVCTRDEGKRLSQPEQNCRWWDCAAHCASIFMSTLATAAATSYHVTSASQEMETGRARTGRQHQERSPWNRIHSTVCKRQFHWSRRVLQTKSHNDETANDAAASLQAQTECNNSEIIISRQLSRNERGAACARL